MFYSESESVLARGAVYKTHRGHPALIYLNQEMLAIY